MIKQNGITMKEINQHNYFKKVSVTTVLREAMFFMILQYICMRKISADDLSQYGSCGSKF